MVVAPDSIRWFDTPRLLIIQCYDDGRIARPTDEAKEKDERVVSGVITIADVCVIHPIGQQTNTVPCMMRLRKDCIRSKSWNDSLNVRIFSCEFGEMLT